MLVKVIGVVIGVVLVAESPNPFPTRSTKAPQPKAAALILASAKDQYRRGATYDPAYVKIGYPRGDVAADRGVCTDVVIRALRAAGYDLQKLIHEDMKAGRFSSYPRRERRPDPNIDHRRVPNQIYYFGRFGKSLTRVVSAKTLDQWKPGDIVYWKFDNGIDHCGIVSDEKTPSGLPLVIHNLGGVHHDDVLTAWKITGHFRFPK
ncbi:MAG TPA: DUF1287 domain-containing protein [Fimbriimonadaceae bacterium]|nr:DUF1287 domain-containing protein [Fimbriimonadaceae bacterium]